MPLFPGHRYLGPGNLLRNGDPVHEDDGIAKSHDEAYERATSPRGPSMECQEIDGNVHITGNQIQQTQSDTSLTQAPATPKCGRRCNRTLPYVQAEQELESYTPFQEKDHADLAKSYWGLKITPGNEEQNGDDERSIPACMGVPRHNFAYDFIHIDKVSPRLTKFVNQFPFKGHVGTPIVNYEYQFGGDTWLKMGPTYNAGNELLTRTHLRPAY
ncbi:hypothetical protein MRX96_001445 [Rhipicephalus microplus]